MCTYIYLYFPLSPRPFLLPLVPYHRRSCSVGHVAPSLLAHRRTTKNHHTQFIRPERERDQQTIPEYTDHRLDNTTRRLLPPRNKDKWVKSRPKISRTSHRSRNFSLSLSPPDHVLFRDNLGEFPIPCTREKRPFNPSRGAPRSREPRRTRREGRFSRVLHFRSSPHFGARFSSRLTSLRSSLLFGAHFSSELASRVLTKAIGGRPDGSFRYRDRRRLRTERAASPQHY